MRKAIGKLRHNEVFTVFGTQYRFLQGINRTSEYGGSYYILENVEKETVFESEVSPDMEVEVDEYSVPTYNEHLIPLAETINAARIEANNHVHTEQESGVYGQLSKSLKDVLYFIVGNRADVEKVYATLIDGNTVILTLDLYRNGSL